MSASSSLRLYEQLEPDLGRNPALHIAQALESVRDELKSELTADLATREDLAAFRSELKGDIAELRAELHEEIGGLRAELHEQIGGLRAELHEQIGGLRAELHDEIGGLRAEMRDEIGGLRAELLEVKAEIRVEMITHISGLRDEIRSEIHRMALAQARAERRQMCFNGAIVLAILLVNRDALTMLAQLLHLVR